MSNVESAQNPNAFPLHLFYQGRNYDAQQFFGAHSIARDGAELTVFRVWAPNAINVSVVGDFNCWDGRRHPMRLLGQSGIWDLFIPGLKAGDLYKYAADPAVGPIAGWPAHQSIDESRDVIRNVFNGKEAYAVCLKEDGKAIGAIELKLNGHTDMTDRDDECELGYWIGKLFWGQGIIPEAAKEMLRHGFEDLGMTRIWVGYYEGNTKSKRVQEKCGFRYEWKSEGVDVPLLHEKRTGHVSSMTKEQWLQDRMYT
jgi:RimJ/RimL family protein N-acetyltransferase